MLEILLLLFIYLSVASYTDIKTREVPDWISFSMIIAALGVRGLMSVVGGYQIVLSGATGSILCFGIGYFYIT